MMRKPKLFKKYNRGDLVIAFSVMIQPLLVVLQFLMISVLLMPEEQTTKYRVVLTAIPMLAAIWVGVKRKPSVFAASYIALFFFLGLEYLFFPANGDYIISGSFRFLVPMIVPSIICLSCLKSIEIIEDVLYVYSWIIVAMILCFILHFVQGRAAFDSYNMGLSYALLLPMVTLYKKGGLCSYLGAMVCFLSILVFGSRGALVAGVLYFIYDLYKKDRKYLFYILIASFFIVNLAIFFSDYLESLGISSRTLMLIVGGRMSSPEGRDSIYSKAGELIKENWFSGLGVYGDRVNMAGEYCHNIVLEFLVDYGVLFGTLFVTLALVCLVKLYIRLDKSDKQTLIKYVIILLVPFFVSSSYLIDCNFGVFCGIVALMANEARCRKKKYVRSLKSPQMLQYSKQRV